MKAALSVNAQLIAMYWGLGQDIVQWQEQYEWGSDFINQLSKDLSIEFPDIKGFSRGNLYYIKRWYLFFRNYSEKVPQAVEQIEKNLQPAQRTKKVQQFVGQIPWGHNRLIVEKVKDVDQAIWYIQQTIANSWSRNILSMQIESKLYERQAKTGVAKVTNFSRVLPKNQSDLVENTLKDPYVFDFLGLSGDVRERKLEKNLTDHIREFLLELGVGLAFVGTQYHLEVGDEDFYIDMLFYHLRLRSYVVIELKTIKFKPEYAGKLNFYLSVVDDLVKSSEDNPTIGLLLCKEKSKLVAEYSLRDLNRPIGVSGYQLDDTISNLPTVEEIGAKLNEKTRDVL